MHIAVRSTEKQRLEFEQKSFDPHVSITWLSSHQKLFHVNADAVFDLVFNDVDISANEFVEQTLVFANAVSCTGLNIGRKNYVRINAWEGFLKRPLVEIAGNNDEYNMMAAKTLNALGWKYVWTADDHGFISARIVAMIINEAYYALEERVSTKEQIDVAMKLGTNYPLGPFEWSEKIGINNIYELLRKLSMENDRYTIAPLLRQTALDEKQNRF